MSAQSGAGRGAKPSGAVGGADREADDARDARDPGSVAGDGTRAEAGVGAGAGDPDAQLSYEEARDQLLAVVQRLETGGVSLQESVDLWERGERLAEICQRWLDGARARLDAAIKDS